MATPKGEKPTIHVLVTTEQKEYLDGMKENKRTMNSTVIGRLIALHKSAVAAAKRRADATGSVRNFNDTTKKNLKLTENVPL